VTIRWAWQPDVPDPCLMPIGTDRVCMLPGDHGGGCDDPTEPPARAIRCLCSHIQHRNGQCWSRACGCQTNRPADVPGSMNRHPAGKAREDKQ
jgi:hypothetical protein